MTLNERLVRTALMLLIVLPHDYFALIMWGISEEHHFTSPRATLMSMLFFAGWGVSLVMVIGAFWGWKAKHLVTLALIILLLWTGAVLGWQLVSVLDPRYLPNGMQIVE